MLLRDQMWPLAGSWWVTWGQRPPTALQHAGWPRMSQITECWVMHGQTGLRGVLGVLSFALKTGFVPSSL